MRQSIIALSLILSLFYSCKENQNKIQIVSIKDTVLKEHFLMIDSLPYYDTNDFDYQILRAYYNNDSVFFKKLQADITYKRNNKGMLDFMDTCIHQQLLKDLKTDEAYRFIYSAAFCPYKLNVTITKTINKYNLHFIIYQFRWDTADCRIINEYDRSLTESNWKQIDEALDNADFWGLKEDNGVHGLDGSTLQIDGYIKGDSNYLRSSKSHSISRWSPGPTAIFNPFTLVLKFSGNRQGCLWVQ